MENSKIYKNNIVFILGIISQPRCIKRIESFIDKGYNVKVYGFDRKVYSANAIVKGIEINILGQQDDGRGYISKFLQIKQSMKVVLNNEQPLKTVFYSFGFIFTLFLFLHKVKYIYEISDILYGYKKYVGFQWFFKSIDKMLIEKSILTVLTSDGFLNYFYKKKKPKNIIVQPNRLNPIFNEIERPLVKKINTERLVFAYVGAFRYPNTVFRFAEIIGKKFPKHQFHFYGDSILTDKVVGLSKKYRNVLYFGAFKNPQDLTSIYNNIDVNVACYDIEGLNEKIAEPNKLYESLYYHKPIIVSKNTFLDTQVQKLKCGYSIDATIDKNIETFIDTITSESLQKIHSAIEIINLDSIIDDNAIHIIEYLRNY